MHYGPERRLHVKTITGCRSKSFEFRFSAHISAADRDISNKFSSTFGKTKVTETKTLAFYSVMSCVGLRGLLAVFNARLIFAYNIISLNNVFVL